LFGDLLNALSNAPVSKRFKVALQCTFSAHSHFAREKPQLVNTNPCQTLSYESSDTSAEEPVNKMAALAPFVKQDTSGLIGTAVPAVKLDLAFGNAGDFDLAARCSEKKVILVGLPGAFTPT